jgi:catechol 2,3-dioxygenase-like lactoylglutathione lyase family enzyme
MKQTIQKILDEYDRGTLSRTEVVETLTAIAAAPPSRPASSVFRARTLNHMTLRVSDRERSKAFYQEMFGLPVINQTDDGYNLELEDSFLGIYQAEKIGLCHFCIGIANFQFESVMERLKQGPGFLEPTSRGRRVFLRDPDGINIQLSAVDYRGL